MNRLKYILQHRYYLKILTFIILICALITTSTIHKESIYKNETEFIGKIYRITKKEEVTTIYLKTKEKLIIKYYDRLDDIYLGDTIKVTGELTKPSNNTIPNLFNYCKYLYNENIFYIVKASKITKTKNNTSIIYYLRNKIYERINSLNTTNQYLSVFLLGDKSSMSEDVMESYRNNGITHLFSISGMHISLFTTILFFILKRLSYNNFYNYSLVISFLLCYTLLIGVSASVLRSLIMYILFALNKLFNLKINSLNIMLLLLIIILIINPYYIYNQSFQYSYIVSFTLVINRHKLKHIKNNYLKSLYISTITFLVSLPICLYNYYQVNIISIILNMIYIPIVSLVIFPLALIVFIIPKLLPLLNALTNVIEKVSLIISNNNFGVIIFSKPSILLILVYYLLIFLFIQNQKYPLIFMLILLHKVSIYFDNSSIITYLDVGQGDSILIKLPHNQNNILIDTGGDAQNGYEIAKKRTIPYLKSLGITRIKYFIVTHGDYDHMGEAINLVNSFKVEKVIFNCGEYNDLEQELIKVLNKKKISYYPCIKELNIDNNKLYFLQTKEYDNENDNSNVIYTEIDGYKFMFMGDAGIEKEKDILKQYNINYVDVLKVGHHGSRTSSSKEFINKTNPKYSIISVGKNNRYGHPNKEVLNNLDNSKIYRTDQDGSIMFKIKNNKSIIETCSP